jgi:hypothetical protein
VCVRAVDEAADRDRAGAERDHRIQVGLTESDDPPRESGDGRRAGAVLDLHRESITGGRWRWAVRLAGWAQPGTVSATAAALSPAMKSLRLMVATSSHAL